MYWPSTSSDGEFIFHEVDGDLLNQMRFLPSIKIGKIQLNGRYQKAAYRGQREITKQADPLEKPGLIGAFCRAYSVTAAMNVFLEDIYCQSAMAGRYDYIPADSQAGIGDL